MPVNDCTHTTDPLKLVREGSSQAQRQATALDPAYAPVDQRTVAHHMVFARAYSAFLKYFDASNTKNGDWQPFFAADVSVQLAMAAVQDVELYKASIYACFDFLNNRDNASNEAELKNRLGQLFGSVATLAAQLEQLKEGLPSQLPLKAQLKNLIGKQLAPAFKMLLLYHRDGLQVTAPPPSGPYHHEVRPSIEILGAAFTLEHVKALTFSSDWIVEDKATDWKRYIKHLDNTKVYPPTMIYGGAATLFNRINHIATHNLFTSVFERFLKVYARTVIDAGAELASSLTNNNAHEPHYALFLAFLRLFEHVREESNTLTERHLDFYYRQVLRLKERGAQPSHVHLLAELAKPVSSYLIEAGTLLKAGKDGLGKEAYFSVLRDTVLNQARVAALQTVYRHDAETIRTDVHGKYGGRLFASSIANSADGLGAPLEDSDPSWHPFHNKQYLDGGLASIRMPYATVGFAIASHYLLLAEGRRSITLDLTLASNGAVVDLARDASCLLTTAEGWLEKPILKGGIEQGALRVELVLDGADPAITPYRQNIHGQRFATDLPVLQVLLRHRTSEQYAYAMLQDVVVRKYVLKVAVEGLKTLKVSNDFGPVDTSRPFQPFGALPVVDSALVIGSKEMFQKQLSSATVHVQWLEEPQSEDGESTGCIDFLRAGQWSPTRIDAIDICKTDYPLTGDLEMSVLDEPDLSAPAFHNTESRQGYMRIRLKGVDTMAEFQRKWQKYLSQPKTQPVPILTPPPVMSALSLSYSASQTVVLDSASEAAFAQRKSRFFHVAPFGEAEQHPLLNSARKVHLMPQFAFRSVDAGTASGGELYIGVSGLQPPQNLTLLMEVAPGTADPLVTKPAAHITWSYLCDNQWLAFTDNAVSDGTQGLLSCGIVTLSVPRAASSTNTLLAPGMHWIRLAVADRVDSACRLLMVAAQALEARFVTLDNDPAFTAKVLPAGTITRLAQPDPAIKQLVQPFSTFGGRGAETRGDLRTRISERLRHKDRAITLWDSEHLILDAFPQIYKVKCLNHTQYESDASGVGIYRELAPGHVTVVALANQQLQNQRDPLRPYTSLDLLQQIETFLLQRCACFVKLHVRNPQFEEVRLAFKVRLHDGYDESYHITRLKEDVTRFLSPWAFPGGGSPSFGGKVYKSVLIHFVEQRPYVDYVSDFQLFHDIAGVPGRSDLDEVVGSLAVSMLVSAPANKHVIEVMHPMAAANFADHCPCEPT
ncbi:hypothetical protein ACIQUS_20090 [Pseudomonas sp. NPDC090755]|uniref:hypothetical protein n=1 Tax=Pseudomonas sp. NPDC090755 TaxID=3364481 RepID=UPI00383BBAE4